MKTTTEWRWRKAVLVAGVAAFLSTGAWAAAGTTRNVFLITTDGLRWEEVFRGAEETLISREFGQVGDTNGVRREFWDEDPKKARAKLLPFFWSVIAKEGQLWGNRDLNSSVRVANTQHFSYPGYSEFLTGYADPEIQSNDKFLNANTNVFEWLNRRPGFEGKVAASVNWDVLPWILNAPRSGFPIWSGFDVPPGTTRMKVPDAVTEMSARARTIWQSVLLDTFTGYAAKHAVREFKPRALYVSYGETDDWAHEGKYERYLRAAREFDRFVSELWELVQSMPVYRGTTTFVITTDHGRGPAPLAWKDHGRAIAASAYIWFAVMGPDTPALGERRDTPLITQSQVAATVAAFVGEDFHGANPRSAPPVQEVIGSK
jgi:hypothetical protein